MAIDRGWWQGINPIRAAKKLDIEEQDDEGEWLRPTEAPVVLEALAPRWQPLFATAIYGALRKSELRALQKSAVDFSTGTIKVARSGKRKTTKSGRRRHVPIHPELLPYLQSAVDASRSELVFPGSDGQMMREDVKLQQVLKRAMARAGLVSGYQLDAGEGCAAMPRVPAPSFKRDAPPAR
jgi:integrase